MEVLGTALERGHISVRRAAVLLGLTIEDLQELFATHGVDLNIDL